MATTALKVSQYFLKISQPEIGDILSNLKVQKLVYYAQGFNLALNNEPLFNEDIQAWEHGPVVKELYDTYREHGSGEIPVPEEDIDFSDIEAEQKEILDEIYQVYGQFSAWKLRNMTHEERPWIETQRNHVISHELMRDYFLTQING